MPVDLNVIDRAVAEAHLPTLLVSLVHITGNTDHLTDDLKPTAVLFGDKNAGGLNEEKQAFVRQFARKAIATFLEGDRKLPPPPSDATVDRMVKFLLGEISQKYRPYVMEALSIDGRDHKEPHWESASLRSAARAMKAVVIGGGMSGILAGIRLSQAGIPFVIIEKNPDFGGTWYENSYPGCRVDTDNQTYAYSFEPNDNWPQHFSTQPVLLDYFRRVARKYDLAAHTRFNTQAVEAKFDDAKRHWRVTLRDAQGGEETVEATAVFSAVGQLNQPKLPDIEGRDTFQGATFHSARWRHDVDLSGKRIAVIGTGASAFQFIPKLAETASKLTVFQRSTTYLAPTPDYHDDVGAGQLWLLQNLPGYARWYRLWLFWLSGSDFAHALIKRDPAWPRSDSMNEAAYQFQQMLIGKLRDQTGDGPLFEALTPNFPIWGKRLLRDNGEWVKTLQRQNVSLVTTGIREITPKGIVTKDGVEHDVDVIVYGTGFHASDFLRTVKVTGERGLDLRQKWDGDAHAYLGAMVPGFPNFFMLYGPNTNVVVNISVVFFAECAMHFALELLKLAAKKGAATADLKEKVYDEFNRRADEAGAQLAWCAPSVSSWYKNAKDRSAQNWPFPQMEYWAATSKPDPAEFVFKKASEPA